MKWLPFAILATLAIICQTTIVHSVTVHQVWPDWMFVLAVHYALWGPWPDAALAGWILGLVVGLQSSDRIGLHAFAYGLAAWVIIRTRHVVFRQHPLTQIVVTFIFALVVQLIVGIYRQWGANADVISGGIWWPALFTALYTAAWAPLLHWLLLKAGRWTGLRPTREYGMA
jgi:rod shape-determining protein MreD